MRPLSFCVWPSFTIAACRCVASTCLETYAQVKKKNDLTVLKYVNAKNPMVCALVGLSNVQSQDPGELVTTTHRDYDLSEISKSMRGIMMGCMMIGVMHFYLGYTNPYVTRMRVGINTQAYCPKHCSA